MAEIHISKTLKEEDTMSILLYSRLQKAILKISSPDLERTQHRVLKKGVDERQSSKGRILPCRMEELTTEGVVEFMPPNIR
ncbi:hypothetical protein L1987_28528 [Smallanthus sonchifolius]|uniref:Uncharacterized protein n=1 Tax=Smallanthus sonchifolius TaxID=185202 RepID=A0ACB9HX93_9ASTR|nr:hypothetical protein L1987_28528 [Smallanthus sonchifolius]